MSESLFIRLTPKMKQDIEKAAKQAAEAVGLPDQESFVKIWRDAIVNSAQEMVMTGSNQILIDFEDGTVQALPEGPWEPVTEKIKKDLEDQESDDTS